MLLCLVGLKEFVLGTWSLGPVWTLSKVVTQVVDPVPILTTHNSDMPSRSGDQNTHTIILTVGGFK